MPFTLVYPTEDDTHDAPHAALIRGPAIPLLMYGGSGKGDMTATLTEAALRAGFTGIDTANYPGGYNEKGTGDGFVAALKSGIKRENLFVQSKFSPVQMHAPGRVPYNPTQQIEDQVRESIQQTFQHLQVSYLDSLILHVSYAHAEDNMRVWKVFEEYVPSKISYIGVSNFNLAQLRHLYDNATIKPTFIQNRFTRANFFDRDVRDFCKAHRIIYQEYSMLRGNDDLLRSHLMESVAKKLDVEPSLAFYILFLCLGDVQVLDGTTRLERMKMDLRAVNDVFGDGGFRSKLKPSVKEFKKLLDKVASEYVNYGEHGSE